MKQFLSILLGIGTVAFFIFGMFIMTDVTIITSQHEWLEGTKMEGNPLVFYLIWCAGLVTIVMCAIVMLLNPDLWKSVKQLDAAKIKADEKVALYEDAKDALAIEAFGYNRRKEALHEKILEYTDMVKDLETVKEIRSK